MNTRNQLKRGRTVFPISLTLQVKFAAAVATAMFLCSHSLFGAFGETEEQCNLRYGTGVVVRFDAETKTKVIRYDHILTADVDAEFKDGVVDWINYRGHGTFRMGNSDIARFLDENSSGHKWALTYSNGEIEHDWMRDDGVKASEYLEPNVKFNPKTFFTVSIPTKPASEKSEATIMQTLGKALLVALLMGTAIYIGCKLIVLVLEVLIKMLPKK